MMGSPQHTVLSGHCSAQPATSCDLRHADHPQLLDVVTNVVVNEHSSCRPSTVKDVLTGVVVTRTALCRPSAVRLCHRPSAVRRCHRPSGIVLTRTVCVQNTGICAYAFGFESSYQPIVIATTGALFVSDGGGDPIFDINSVSCTDGTSLSRKSIG